MNLSAAATIASSARDSVRVVIFLSAEKINFLKSLNNIHTTIISPSTMAYNCTELFHHVCCKKSFIINVAKISAIAAQ